MASRPVDPKPHMSTKQWLPLVIVAIGLYVVVPQLQIFRRSLLSLHHLNYGFIGLAVVAVALTFIFGATVYTVLAPKKLAYSKTLIAQLAANFINRLLPAGIGGIGANFRYLRRHKHSSAQAASVVTANNGLGLVGHLLLVLALSLGFHAHLAPISVSPRLALAVAGAGAIVGALALTVPAVRRRLGRNFRSFGRQLATFRSRPLTIVAALALQICLTLSNVTAFWLCILAFHVSLSFVAALLIFTLGFGLGNATPTPGGLGGVEAGLVAGLAAYHVPAATALAVVLAYRLVSYWVPLAISAPVFVYASRRHYF